MTTRQRRVRNILNNLDRKELNRLNDTYNKWVFGEASKEILAYLLKKHKISLEEYETWLWERV